PGGLEDRARDPPRREGGPAARRLRPVELVEPPAERADVGDTLVDPLAPRPRIRGVAPAIEVDDADRLDHAPAALRRPAPPHPDRPVTRLGEARLVVESAHDPAAIAGRGGGVSRPDRLDDRRAVPPHREAPRDDLPEDPPARDGDVHRASLERFSMN